MIHTKYIDIGDRADGRGFITIEARDGYRHMAYYDHAGIQRVMFGQPGQNPNRVMDGLYVRDVNGNDILTANGLGVRVAGQDQLVSNAVTVIHSADGPNISFVSAPRSPAFGPYVAVPNNTLWTVSVAVQFAPYARLAISDPSGVRYLPLGLEVGTAEGLHPIINIPANVSPSSLVTGVIQEISSSDMPGIPRNTWYNASSYPYARRSPYKIVVLEVKR